MTIDPICFYCRRLFEGSGRTAVGLSCEAFPDGIPRAILMMDHDHHRPYPGDGGLLFSPVPGHVDRHNPALADRPVDPGIVT